jgi:carbonic anhydrase
VVTERINDGRLKVHGWWFELSTANVYAYDETTGSFALVE